MKYNKRKQKAAQNLKRGQQPRNIPSNLKLEHIKINYKQIRKMSYFYFSPVYNFSPYPYGQYMPNQCQLAYTPISIQESLVVQSFQQQKLFTNFQQEVNTFKEYSNQPMGIERIEEGNTEKSIKIKKRRGINKQKELQSAKKNSQSNIINQFFSYFSCRSQSEEIVEKAIASSVRNIEELQKIISIFYNIMKCMSLQRIKKYVNKKTLLNIFAKQNIQKEIPEILQKFQALAFITIDEITEVVRRCCFYYLRNISLISILASKRISALSKREHLKKRRQLCGIVSGKL